MPTTSLVAALVIAFTSVLSASCLQGPLETDVTASPTASIERPSEPSGPEPTGDAQQPMGPIWRPYGSKDWLSDDGADEGGGCQRSITSLGFSVLHGIHVVYRWKCRSRSTCRCGPSSSARSVRAERRSGPPKPPTSPPLAAGQPRAGRVDRPGRNVLRGALPEAAKHDERPAPGSRCKGLPAAMRPHP